MHNYDLRKVSICINENQFNAIAVLPIYTGNHFVIVYTGISYKIYQGIHWNLFELTLSSQLRAL